MEGNDILISKVARMDNQVLLYETRTIFQAPENKMDLLFKIPIKTKQLLGKDMNYMISNHM